MEKQYPTVKLTLICEDIRGELYKKLSLIGVYTSDVILAQSLPVKLLKFCVYQKLVGGQGEFSLAVKVQDPQGKELYTWRTDKTPHVEPTKVLDICLQIGNITFESEGVYKVLTFLDDSEKPSSVFEFQVKKGDVKP